MIPQDLMSAVPLLDGLLRFAYHQGQVEIGWSAWRDLCDDAIVAAEQGGWQADPLGAYETVARLSTQLAASVATHYMRCHYPWHRCPDTRERVFFVLDLLRTLQALQEIGVDIGVSRATA